MIRDYIPLFPTSTSKKKDGSPKSIRSFPQGALCVLNTAKPGSVRTAPATAASPPSTPKRFVVLYLWVNMGYHQLLMSSVMIASRNSSILPTWS